MVAARYEADGVANLLIEAKAELDAKSKVRPVGVHMYMRGGWLACGRAGRAVSMSAACMHACAEVQQSLPPLAR